MELKELVDVFSNLADVKDTHSQALLFTEDAVLTSYIGDKIVSEQTGRNEIEKGCAEFLALFDTVYHMNGQQVVEVNGDQATGKAYCQVVLICNKEQENRNQITQGVVYDDVYVKRDGKWYIAKRTSHFVWSDVKEIL